MRRRRPARSTLNRALARLSRPAGDFDAARYFRGDHRLRFYNVSTGTVRALVRDIHAAYRDRWSLDDAMRLADELIVDRHLETKAVGIELVARYRRAFRPALLPRWKRWLAGGHAANWATTDSICGCLIGPLLVAHPGLAPTLAAWARHRVLWVRRASIVGLLPLARTGRALDQLYATARTLHADREDLVQKAVGWALREAGRPDPPRLERYLRANGPSIPRTTLRYAIERFPDAKRHALMAATRPQAGAGPRAPGARRARSPRFL